MTITNRIFLTAPRDLTYSKILPYCENAVSKKTSICSHIDDEKREAKKNRNRFSWFTERRND